MWQAYRYINRQGLKIFQSLASRSPSLKDLISARFLLILSFSSVPSDVKINLLFLLANHVQAA